MSFLSYLVGLLSHHLEISSPYKKPLCHFGPLVLSTQNEHAGGTLKILNSSNQTEILSDFADKFIFKTQIAVFISLVTHCKFRWPERWLARRKRNVVSVQTKESSSQDRYVSDFFFLFVTGVGSLNNSLEVA